MAQKFTARAFKVAVWYFVAAATYIVASGYLLGAAAADPETYLHYEIAKGIGFVAVSSVLLYALMRGYLRAMTREVARQAEIEQELRRSRDQLAAAQEIARLGSWEADLVTGDLSWSEEVYRIFGVGPAAFGHTVEAFAKYVHADDRADLEHAQRRALAGEGALEIEHRIVRPDGEVRYVLERAEVRTDDHGKPLLQIGTVQDITERKRVELELEKRNRQQAAIAELGMQALGHVSLRELMDRAMAAAARALDVELTGVLELLPDGETMRLVTGIGWPADQLGRGSVPADHNSLAGYTLSVNEPVVVEDLRTETRFTAPQVLLERGVVSGIATIIRDDEPWGVLGVHTTRRLRFTDADVAFVQALANLIGDVLQRERAMSAIQERNILRQLASEAASLGGWACEPGSGIITWSEEAARIHDVPPESVPASVKAGLDFCAPEYRGRITQRFEACVRDGIPYDEEAELITGRGRRIWVRIIGKAERDRSGRVVRVHGAIQDISERKALESMLHQSQRLEAVGQLTGGIAHDFNNLLTVILGNADQLLEDAGYDESIRIPLQTIRRAAVRSAELTNRLLAYARKQPLEPEPTNVPDLLAGMDQLLRRSLGEQVEIEMVRAEGLWTAMVDPAQLESAVLNLCLNARDAMPEGGRLTLETANVHLDSAYADHQREIIPGHYVMIAVTDTGHGVAPEVAERVFEPFFTTKPAGLGSGLGLSMVYGFAKQSRGHVKLYSEPRHGTTVKLYLPRTWDEARPPGRPAQSVTRGRGERVLVVEDDDLVRSFVADQVAALGYQVLTAANGAQAMAILEARSDVDLLFTDVVMPGSLDGRQLAEAAQNLHPDLPVLFTSGYTENAMVHQGRLDPGVALLSKPYRLSELAKGLDVALHRERN